MHNAAFAALGLKAHYEALDVPPTELGKAVADLRRAEVLGANVTVPHKLAVMPHLDDLSPEAEAIGAVNTVIHEDGHLLGHNTDAEGFLRALEAAGFDPAGKRAVVLGAGGAARAVVYGLLGAGSSVHIHNRTVRKAQALASAFRHGEAEPLAKDELMRAVRGCDLLVNTTSVGMETGGRDPDVSPLLGDTLPERGLVCDIIYKPAETRLLRSAAAAGLDTQNGLPMLVYQGAASFERWTGRAPDVGVMFGAARASLGV